MVTAGFLPSLSSFTRPTSRQSILGCAGLTTSSVCHLHNRDDPIQTRHQNLGRLQRPAPKPTPTRRFYHAAGWPSYGVTTPAPNRQLPVLTTSPFRFETGYALYAKRPSRPFPPPFLSPPSFSFSDPLTTQSLNQDRRLSVKGELIRGLNNGDDAILVAENFLGVNDGVGAWTTRPRGHAA